MADTRHLVIVGGGTAGWMTAASLAQTLPSGNWSITLVESPEIGIIGVGEGSFPTLRGTIARLGHGLPGGDERSFMRAARATFKQGVRFVGWAGQPTPARTPTITSTPSTCPAMPSTNACSPSGWTAASIRAARHGPDH
jgi:hypothetical protein